MSTSTGTREHDHTHAQNRFAVIPTPQRLGANTEYTGKGITIAFLDSGFYPHPDLTQPDNRIIAFADVTQYEAPLKVDTSSQAWEWHGTQTSAVAGGNGYLSDGIYRGLASDASVVLVKVSDRGRISDENIVRGIEWVIENKDVYDIRVISMSLGGDEDISFNESTVDMAAEKAVQAGLIVVVAAGNSGCSENPRPIPPANSPSVITVGGYNDNNRLDNSEFDLYCSNYGHTIDGIVKPEIIAPAIWVAAPILPGTDSYYQAEALSQLAAAPEYLLKRLAMELEQKAGLPKSIRRASPEEIRATVEALIKERKIVATHYQHVDGTSFAAPIVASVVAQMLEANPTLSPQAIKNILISTADRITNQSLLRQGYGVLNAGRAVEEARHEQHTHQQCDFGPPRIEGDRLIFWLHHDQAESAVLAGEFNGWEIGRDCFIKQSHGMWRAEIELLAPGSYQYKFVINGSRWIEDSSNGLKVSDNHGGFNSVLHIAG